MYGLSNRQEQPHGVGVERLALVQSELDKTERIERLHRQWADAAERFNDWLSSALLSIDTRWPVLDGVALQARI